ncbi:MAG TPA: hypothetical protein PLP21_11255 [Pyrinomonadaceae bacterium]|nr:hypothetical protein [Pyrinomonadaceae bacterium]
MIVCADEPVGNVQYNSDSPGILWVHSGETAQLSEFMLLNMAFRYCHIEKFVQVERVG